MLPLFFYFSPCSLHHPVGLSFPETTRIEEKLPHLANENTNLDFIAKF